MTYRGPNNHPHMRPIQSISFNFTEIYSYSKLMSQVAWLNQIILNWDTFQKYNFSHLGRFLWSWWCDWAIYFCIKQQLKTNKIQWLEIFSFLHFLLCLGYFLRLYYYFSILLLFIIWMVLEMQGKRAKVKISQYFCTFWTFSLGRVVRLSWFPLHWFRLLETQV